MTDTKPSCAHCGGELSGRGSSDSKTGLLFHATGDCQRARDRYNAQLRRRGGVEPEIESRPCSCCDTPLESRPKRATDLNAGRWCHRTKCRNHRSVVLAQISDRRRRWDYAEVAKCPKCGREDGRVGFEHLDYDHDVCDGIGHMSPPIDVARALWMQTADELRAEFKDLPGVLCQKCGRKDARKGFVHPDLKMITCEHLGLKQPPMDLARELWAPRPQ